MNNSLTVIFTQYRLQKNWRFLKLKSKANFCTKTYWCWNSINVKVFPSFLISADNHELIKIELLYRELIIYLRGNSPLSWWQGKYIMWTNTSTSFRILSHKPIHNDFHTSRIYQFKTDSSKKYNEKKYPRRNIHFVRINCFITN